MAYLPHVTSIKFHCCDCEFALSIAHDWQPGRRASFESPADPPVVGNWEIDSIESAVVYPFDGKVGFELQLIDGTNNDKIFLAALDSRLHEDFEEEVIDRIIEAFQTEAAA